MRGRWSPPKERPGRTCGLGKPISEEDHYIVRVFYGGYWCEESLEGPFATHEEAETLLHEQRSKGHGAIMYRCSSVKAGV
jgi:hypothetical protein